MRKLMYAWAIRKLKTPQIEHMQKKKPMPANWSKSFKNLNKYRFRSIQHSKTCILKNITMLKKF